MFAVRAVLEMRLQPWLSEVGGREVKWVHMNEVLDVSR